MVAQVAFDTLAFANRLKAAGMEQKQAEAQAGAQAELLSVLVNSELATKTELYAVRTELKQEILATKTELYAVRTELKEEIHRIDITIADLKASIGKQIHTSTITSISVLGTLCALLHFLR
jgi:hypothetical protein